MIDRHPDLKEVDGVTRYCDRCNIYQHIEETTTAGVTNREFFYLNTDGTYYDPITKKNYYLDTEPDDYNEIPI
jgi:hypothetical protein